MARRDLSLVVRAGSQRLGMLRFAQGELLWAEFGALRGEEAFMALASQHSGSVEELAWDGRTERNVSQPLSRLVLLAVEYRETHEHPQPQRPPTDTRSRPVQPVQPPPVPSKPSSSFNGASNSPRLNTTPPRPLTPTPEEEAAPSWVREIHAAQADPHPSPFLREEMAVQIPEPTFPASSPNGGLKLAATANGSKPTPPPAHVEKDDPPTVPLRSVQGGLLSYATKREPPVQEPQREPTTAAKLAIGPQPSQEVPKSAAPIVPTPPPLPPLPDELLPDTAPLGPPAAPVAAPAPLVVP